MRLANDKIDTEVVTFFFDNSESYVVIVQKTQLEFLTSCNNESSFNDKNNAPCLARNSVDGHNCAGVSE